MESINTIIENALNSGSFFSFCLVYIGGVLTSMTPCIYPMVPITVSVIGGQKQTTKLSSFLLSLTYVAGLAVTYSILGTIAVAGGTLFGSFSSNIWILFIIANICILFGLSMLDVFMISLPSGLATKFQSGNKKGGTFLGVFALGAMFGLVASPCTAPVLGVILAYVGTKGSYVLGASLLFVYAFGVGTLLIAIGTFSGIMSHLPKAGNWMNIVKKVFGWLMIAMGEYYLIQMGKGMF